MNMVKCKKCGIEFTYRLEGTVYPGCKTAEDVDCPECGEVAFQVMTSQFVVTEKLEKEKEKQLTENK